MFRLLLNRLTLGLLLAFCLYHGLSTARGSFRDFRDRHRPDEITAFGERIAPLKSDLSKYRTVGYVTDQPENGDWFIDYYRFQYALAPIIVKESAEEMPVIGNFHDPVLQREILKNKHLIVVSDYGQGVLLLSREAN